MLSDKALCAPCFCSFRTARTECLGPASAQRTKFRASGHLAYSKPVRLSD
eukprot:COSAG02_NODE_62239_length_266_cov_0.886228_1_plen_49_part_01